MSLPDKVDVSSQGGLGNLNITQLLLKMKVLFQIASYIREQVSLLCWGISQGQLIKTDIIEVYTQVQQVLLGGWFGSKLVVANYTKQFY